MAFVMTPSTSTCFMGSRQAAPTTRRAAPVVRLFSVDLASTGNKHPDSFTWWGQITCKCGSGQAKRSADVIMSQTLTPDLPL